METNTQKTTGWECALGMLLARIWLGLRSLQTGIEKFAITSSSEELVDIDGAANSYGLTAASQTKSYGFEHYQGVPAALYDKLAQEPLIPVWALNLYNLSLGPLLILLGITVLLGIGTRISLFAMGVLYTSLTFGLILLKQDAGVAWLGIHVLMIMAALFMARHDRIALLRKY